MDDAHTIRLAAQELLRAHGPLHLDDLDDLLRDCEISFDSDDLWSLLLGEWDDQLEQEAVFSAWPLTDGRLADLDHLLDGMVLTHRVSPSDRRRGEVAKSPDLDVLWFSTADPVLPTSDGGHLEQTPVGTVRLIDQPLPDGAHLICTWRDGMVEVRGTDDVPAPDAGAAATIAAARLRIEDHYGHRAEPGMLIIESLAGDPDLFRDPSASLQDHLALAGLRIADRGWIVGEDEDDDGFMLDDGDDVETLMDHLVVVHALTAGQAAAVMGVGLAVEQAAAVFVDQVHDRLAGLADDDITPEDVGSLAAGLVADVDPSRDDGAIARLQSRVVDDDLTARAMAVVVADGPTADAYLHDIVQADRLMAMLTLAAVQAAEPTRDKAGRANRHWLTGRLMEFVADDHTEVEREYRTATTLDPDHGEATYALAQCLSDRGRAGAALGLLRQLQNSGGEREWTDLLEVYAAPGPMTAGRNDPCPCGSGRKHKVCCATTNGWPLLDRVHWVWLKVAMFAASGPAWELLEDVSAIADDRNVLESSLLRSAVYHEGGLIEEFLRVRGPLLPPDELELLHVFADVRATALQVVETPTGGGFIALDHVTGERVTVAEEWLRDPLAVDDVVLAWLLPTSGGPITGGISVAMPEHARQSLLALVDTQPDAEDIAEWVMALAAPPTMLNREGHSLAFTTLTWTLEDPEDAMLTLGEHFEDDMEGGFVDLIDPDGERTLAASLTFGDHELIAEVNSAERAARLVDRIAQLLPDAELVDTQVRLLEDLEPGEFPTPPGGTGFEDLSPDEIAEVMDQVMTEQEERWVDLSIPALGGMTPREAAADPTRRDDLDRLLRGFAASEGDWPGPGRPMSAANLRALLDIT